MRRINILIAGLLLLASSLLMSCEKEDRTYQGPAFYEFSPIENGQSNYKNIFIKASAALGKDTICVQMIKTLATPTTVKFRVVDQLYYINSRNAFVFDFPGNLQPGDYVLYQTSGVYGLDYQIPMGTNVTFDSKYLKGSIVIPAGESFGRIPVEVLKKSGKEIFIVLEDSPEAMANKPTSILSWVLPVDKVVYYQETFASSIPSSWTLIDKDGDSFGWYYEASKQAAASESWSTDPLNPENYLVSPKIPIPTKLKRVSLSFDVAAAGKNYWKESYKVVYSEAPITKENCRNAAVIRDFTQLTEDYKGSTFITQNIDITALSGKAVYFAIVHGSCTDMDRLLIRNFTVYSY